MMLAVSYHILPSYIEVHSFYTHFIEFYNKWLLNLVKCFQCIY